MTKDEQIEKMKNSPALRLAPEVKSLVAFIPTRLDRDNPRCSYAELTTLVSVEVASGKNGARFLDRALEIIRTEKGIAVYREDGQGIVWLTDAEVLERANRQVVSVRRKAKREFTRTSLVNFETLTLPQRLEFFLTKTTLNIQARVANKKQQDKLRVAVTAQEKVLELEAALSRMTG